MDEIVKHINDTNASYRPLGAGDAKNTDLFLDNEHYQLFEGAGEHITVRYHKENLAKAILFIASILSSNIVNTSLSVMIVLFENHIVIAVSDLTFIAHLFICKPLTDLAEMDFSPRVHKGFGEFFCTLGRLL